MRLQRCDMAAREAGLTKIIMIFFAALACIQVIKPIGIRGLEHRRDAWKLAALGFLVIVALMILSVTLKDAALL